jgi:hypothetical protein
LALCLWPPQRPFPFLTTTTNNNITESDHTTITTTGARRKISKGRNVRRGHHREAKGLEGSKASLGFRFTIDGRRQQ